MTWTDDPELQAMFMSELEERSARLVEGGQAMIDGKVDSDVASTMLREGHTIKGTGRVMGYEAVSMAGQQLELLWRRVQSDDLESTPELGQAIVAVASVLRDAGGADPDAGTPELTDAMSALDAALGTGSGPKPNLRAVEPPDDEPEPEAEVVPEPAAVEEPGPAEEPEPEPDPLPAEQPVETKRRPRITPQISDAARPFADDPPPARAVQPEPEPEAAEEFSHEHVRPRRPREEAPVAPAAQEPQPAEPIFAEAASITADLGGLLGAVESWASVETLPVGAGRMYRLINLAARIRIDLEAIEERMQTVRNSDDLDALEASFRLILEATGELEHDAMQLAAVPLSSMTNTLPQLVRFVAKKLDKEVRFEIVGDTEVVVDRQVLDKIADPLRQLVVNAITHGIEPAGAREEAGKPVTGSVALTATIKDRSVEMVVSDDGAGIDWGAVRKIALERGLISTDDANDQSKLSEVLFVEGFSTGAMTDLGGSGKGLSMVSDEAESLFGRVRLESSVGIGTTVTLTVPTSRALQRVLIIETAGMKWGIPESVVEESMPIDGSNIDWSGDEPTLEWGGNLIPVSGLGELVGAQESRLPKHLLVLSHRVGSLAVTVQGVVGVREVAAKELGPLLAGPSHITGAALLGGGEVVLVLDAAALVSGSSPIPIEDKGGQRILVVDDSIGARAVVSGALASSGFQTSVASSAAEALDILESTEVDALVVDFSMPQTDGADLVAEVRGRDINVPIVMLSGVATEEDKTRSKDAGVDVFFDKADFREGALADSLRSLLRGGR